MNNIQMLDSGQKINNIIGVNKLTLSKVTSKKNWKILTKNQIIGILKKTIELRKSWFDQTIRSIKRI